jgi:hypothetical protein
MQEGCKCSGAIQEGCKCSGNANVSVVGQFKKDVSVVAMQEGCKCSGNARRL